jgi:hypothetical protein
VSHSLWGLQVTAPKRVGHSKWNFACKEQQLWLNQGVQTHKSKTELEIMHDGGMTHIGRFDVPVLDAVVEEIAQPQEDLPHYHRNNLPKRTCKRMITRAA